MKKLLVLILVLGIVSMASALTSTPLSVVSDNVTWTVVGDQLLGTVTVIGNYSGFLVDASHELVPDTLSDGDTDGAWAAGGKPCKVIDLSAQLDGWWSTAASDSLGPQSVGKWFSLGFTRTPTVANPIIIDVWNSTAKQGTLTIIPEPMTIALLGLGGLFLRRRK